MSRDDGLNQSPLSLQDVFPELEPGDAVLTPGFASTIEACYLGRVPAFTHLIDLCRLLEILVSHDRVFVPRTGTYWLATDFGGTTPSLFNPLADAGVVKFFYPSCRVLSGGMLTGLLSGGAHPHVLWSPKLSEHQAVANQAGGSEESLLTSADIGATRNVFSLCGAQGLPKSEWDGAYGPLANAVLTSRSSDNVAFSVWGSTFGFENSSTFEGPKLCFIQGKLAAMPPAELETLVSSGKIQLDKGGRLRYGDYSFTPPKTCIDQIKHYWKFIDASRRIASRHGAVLYHAFMERPYVQLKETEFDTVDASSAREAIYRDTSASPDFAQAYSRWVLDYRKHCFDTETLCAPPLAQIVLAGTESEPGEIEYECKDELGHDFRTEVRARKLHRLHDGVIQARRRLREFRQINTEAMIDIAALRVEGRADLARYAKAKRRFVTALEESSESKGAVRKIFSLSNAVEFLGQTMLGNYHTALLGLAKRLGEFLPMSNDLHFGNADTLSGIANVIEDPARSFRDVFGELSYQAKEEMPFFRSSPNSVSKP
jgi:hypothetical protein